MSDADRILAGLARREALAWTATVCGPSWHAVVLDGSVDVLGDGGGSVTGQCDLSAGEAMHIAANNPAHVLAVFAAVREELADAMAQQERHETGRDGERWWCTCTAGQPITVSRCPDAEQANRTLARLAALYGATLTMT